MSEEKDQHWQHWDSVTVLKKNKRQLKDNGSTKSSTLERASLTLIIQKLTAQFYHHLLMLL